MRSDTTAFLYITIACVLSCAALAQPRYRVTELAEGPNLIVHGISPDGVLYGTPNFYDSTVNFTLDRHGYRTITTNPDEGLRLFGINGRGTAVGMCYLHAAGSSRILRTDTQGNPAAISPFGGTAGCAFGIFPDGTIIGWASRDSSEDAYNAFTWRDGAATPLETPPGTARSQALAFSPNGHIVGVVSTAGGWRAVQWWHGSMIQLPPPAAAGDTYPTGVNDDGVTIGYQLGPQEETSIPLVWRGGAVSQLPRPEYAPAGWNIPTAINASGQIVGYDSTVGMVTWIGGHQYDLEWLTNLPEEFNISNAVGIDNAGRIFCNGKDMWLRQLAVMLTPINQCGSADFDFDGNPGTDADISAFFACLAGDCCLLCQSADFDGDSDAGTDADIEAFFTVLSGGHC